MTNVHVSRKDFEMYLRLKKLIEEGYISTKIWFDLLKVLESFNPKEWNVRNMITYQMLQVTLGF